MTQPRILIAFTLALASAALAAQTPATPDWAKLEDETMRHYQALLRFDTFVRFHWDFVVDLARAK